jgi:ABC-type multidrug transport system fused ATPase/permease subunit
MKILIDNVLQGEPLPPVLAGVTRWAPTTFSLLMLTAAAGVVLAIASSLLTTLTNYLDTKSSLGITLNVRSDLFQQAQRLSMTYHDRHRSATIIHIINSTAAAVPGAIMTGLSLAQNVVLLAGMFLISLRLNAALAVLSLSIVPLLYYSVGYYTRRIQHRVATVKDMETEAHAIVHEAISMLRVIRAFGRESDEHLRFRDQGTRANEARVRLTVRQSLFSVAVNATTAIGTALVIGYGATLVLAHRLTIGELLVVLSYIGSVYRPLQTISGTLGSMQDQLANLRFTFGLLDSEPDIRDAPDAIAIETTAGRVVFDDVSFHYHDRPRTLDGVSFEVAPGEAIALVGPTGAGKSTLASLIPRFYDPEKGRILLDDIDIRRLTLKSLRQQISLVLQEPLLFSGTIAENIAYGRPEASMEEIVEAARAANVHDVVSALPNGYDTLCGERGARLSGGERQRITVARAFLKNAPILVLDEPTSSIDSRTEAGLLDALDRLMAGRTTILIAHRLSTLRNVQRILVLDKGRIVERGTHAALIARNGLYRQLYEAQVSQPAPLIGREEPLADAQPA